MTATNHVNILKRFKMIGNSDVMQELGEWIQTVAPLPDHVLITGERGTGKELAARAIHKLSGCRCADIITVDCSALHHATLEASLFGYERGAFTGAVNKRIGYIESSHGGSLFLDEIGTLPLEVQCKFLRFLEEGTITRIGSAKAQNVHTRVIAASNRNLHEEVEQNRFMPDLYDRLNVFQCYIPPLRERNGDIFMLLESFIEKKQRQQFSEDAKAFLLQYPFPGNVRELRHLSRRLSVFCKKDTITADDIQKQLHFTIAKIPGTLEMQRITTSK